MGETSATPRTTTSTSGPGVALLLLAVLALLATVVAVAVSSSPAAAGELERFASCAELRAFTERARVGGEGVAVEDRLDVATEAAPTADADGAARAAVEPRAPSTGLAATGAAPDVGATNTQVAGVDELDRADVAPDGSVLVALDPDVTALRDIDPATGPVDPGRVEPSPSELVLVDGDGAVEARVPLDGYDPRLTWDVGRELAWVVTTPDDPQRTLVRVQRFRTDGGLHLDGEWTITGGVVSGRRLDDRFVLIAVDHPWQPEVLPFESGDGPGTAVPCDEVWHPTGPTAEPGSTLVAAFDAGTADVAPVATAQVVGAAGTVYASADAVYVATTSAVPFAGSTDGRFPEPTTGVHRFDLDDLTLTGSGTVPGHPLSQFSIDEHDGHLRIATTVGGWFAFPVDVAIVDDAADAPRSAPAADVAAEPAGLDNLVTVLDLDGDLDPVGQVRGLGKPGETIQSVRFDGPVGYVVTFQQTDPLYVLDLADPRNPHPVGELEIPGFSSYLHPVGDGLVVGVGTAGDQRGLTGGAWVQLFDVADRQHPALLATDLLGDSSEAQHDHHAFAALGANRFAVPYQDHPVFTDVAAPGAGGRFVPPVEQPAAVRLYDTSARTLARGPELAVTLDATAGYPFIRTAQLADGDLLVVTGDGHLHRFSPAGTRISTTALR